jgi:hypothetical protein
MTDMQLSKLKLFNAAKSVFGQESEPNFPHLMEPEGQ